jgi:hypothetical protein
VLLNHTERFKTTAQPIPSVDSKSLITADRRQIVLHEKLSRKREFLFAASTKPEMSQ